MNQKLLNNAVQLGKEIYESPEGAEYRRTREIAYSEDTTAALIQRYEYLRQISDGELLTKGTISCSTENELTSIANVLQFNKIASDFLLAEYNYTKLLDSVYSILGKETGIPLSRMAPSSENE